MTVLLGELNGGEYFGNYLIMVSLKLTMVESLNGNSNGGTNINILMQFEGLTSKY